MEAIIEYKVLKIFNGADWHAEYIPSGRYKKQLLEFLSSTEIEEVTKDLVKRSLLELKGSNQLAKLNHEGKEYFDKTYYKEQAYDLVDDALNKLNSGSGKDSIDTSHQRYLRVQQIAEDVLEKKELVKYALSHKKWGSMVEILENGYKVVEVGGIRNYLKQKEDEENLKNTALTHLEELSSNQITSQPAKITIMKKLFVSHSSFDKVKIEPLIDLIESIGVPHSQIFFSSNPAFGISLGENIFERLKKELSSDVFAIFILSENFYKSAVCLCEMGAVWIKSNIQIPILIPPFDFKDVKGVFTNSLGFAINDKDQLNSFKVELERSFNLAPIHLSRWEEKRDNFLIKVGELL